MKTLLFLPLLLISASTTSVAAIPDGLLANGDFELGPRVSDMNYTQVIGRHAIPEWEISGFVEYIKSGQKQRDMMLVVPEGRFAVRLGNEATISQRLNLTSGSSYSVTLSAARTCAQQERLNVSASDESDVFPIQTIYSSNGWDSYAWAFHANHDAINLTIHNPGMEEDPACGPLIDSVAIKTINPTPRTNKNLLKNGEFEEGPYIIPNLGTGGVLIPPELEDRHSPLPGWIVESLKAVKYVSTAHSSDTQKENRAIEMVGGRESAIVQIAPTIPNRRYSLAFSVGDSSNRCNASMVVMAFADTSSISVPYESSGRGGFKRAELHFTALRSRSRIMFYSSFYHHTTDGSLCGPVIDDVLLLSVR